MKTPREINISITAHCNLQCHYCSHYSSPTDTKENLPAAEWLHFFQELQQNAVMAVTLSGGEPLSYPQLPTIIEGIVANQMRFNLLSNGTLIDAAFAKFIADTHRCNLIQISLDGATPKIHEASRGQGTFDRALQGLAHLRQAGIKVAVRVTINRFNVASLPEIARFLLEELKLPTFSTNSVGYLGLGRENNETVGLSTADRILAMELLVALSAKYPGRISSLAGPLTEAFLWSEMEAARQQGLPRLPQGGFLTGCGCFWSKLAVRADGIITPCNQMAHLELGRINQDNLQNLWQNHPQLQQLRQRKTIALTNFAQCRACPYLHYCTGNCPAISYNLTRDIYSPSPDACFKRFLAAGGRLPNLAETKLSQKPAKEIAHAFTTK